MSFDDLQKAWQAQNAEGLVTIKADLLLKEVRRNQRQFWATIFWRDVREVGVAFLLAIYFFYHGWWHHNWTYYLSTVACIWIGAYMVVDRQLQKKKKPALNDSLKHCIEDSLAQVNHQIWLLKNVFWWYLLPLLAATAVGMCYDVLHMRHFGRTAMMGEILAAAMVVVIIVGVHRLNQTAVRKSLQPRRKELEALLASLE